MIDEQHGSDRHIEIHRDVINSAIVSGDGNRVVIYHLGQQTQVETKSLISVLSANPYRGLAAFQVEDANVYFGREKEVQRLWNRLRDLHEQFSNEKLIPRVLPILGPSGSGKSSLARAGLLPELARCPLPGYKQVRVVIVKPGEKPLESLAIVLARIATGDPSPVGKAEEFQSVFEKNHRKGTDNGLSLIASLLPEQDEPLVVLVDQFEEIYSLCEDAEQRTAFINTLLEAASTRNGQVSVVIKTFIWRESNRFQIGSSSPVIRYSVSVMNGGASLTFSSQRRTNSRSEISRQWERISFSPSIFWFPVGRIRLRRFTIPPFSSTWLLVGIATATLPDCSLKRNLPCLV
jgi:hypothetical protein